MFTRDIQGSGTSRQLNAHIFSVDVTGGTPVDLSINKPNGTNDTNPRFSPNGAYIIFESASNVIGSQKSIWFMDANGNNRKQLFSNAEMPDWR